jgi:hypothetical protein
MLDHYSEIRRASNQDKLYEYLTEKIPREEWNDDQHQLIFFAATMKDPRSLIVLCKNGANVNMETFVMNTTPMDLAIQNNRLKNMLILSLFGAQFTRNFTFASYQPYNIILFLLGAIVGGGVSKYDIFIQDTRKRIHILLALKRRRIHSMGHLDRFLLKDLAFAIWTEMKYSHV